MFEKVVKELMQLGRAKTKWKVKGTKENCRHSNNYLFSAIT